MKIKMYPLIATIVEQGVQRQGTSRAHKHTDTPERGDNQAVRGAVHHAAALTNTLRLI